jgi:type II secretory pathway pseudopilin PulG
MRVLSSKNSRNKLTPPSNLGGFTFLGLMMVIAIMGVALLAVGEVWHTAQRREKEQSLLFVGDQFRNAIHAYYQHAPAANKQQPYPTSLEDLLKDPRYPSTQRYLRQLYLDPIRGSAEWGLLKKGDGIYGVYSLSEEAPIKQSNFRLADKDLESKSKYSEWLFMYVPTQLANKPIVKQ